MHLKRNIAANFLGTGYGMLLQFLMVPVTLHYLGSQAYGLIGVYVTLLAILGVMDLGLSPALSRELSRLSVLPDGKKLMRNTVTTLEVISVAAAVLIAVLLWFLAPLLAKYWLNKTNLPLVLVTNCLQLMGLQAAFQFLAGYYNSGLIGLQKIVLSNAIVAVTQSLRVIVIVFLLITKPDIEAYFIALTLLGFITLGITATALYCALPQSISSQIKSDKTFFQRYYPERFDACKKFAGGMVATTLATLALTQLDKVILSKMLSLEDFGYYTIAVSLASMLTKPATLVLTATLPRMTQLATASDEASLEQLYLKSSALVSWLVLPVTGLLVAFSVELLTVYLSSAENAYKIAPLFSILAIGYALHAITHIPYGLTIAYGWSKFGVYFGIINSIVLIPMIIIATNAYGAMGAAIVWGGLCLSYITVYMVIIHKKYLGESLPRWYKKVFIYQGALFVAFTLVGYLIKYA
jgi:O-antigen/teichoic acid export membrane protein